MCLHSLQALYDKYEELQWNHHLNETIVSLLSIAFENDGKYVLETYPTIIIDSEPVTVIIPLNLPIRTSIFKTFRSFLSKLSDNGRLNCPFLLQIFHVGRKTAIISSKVAEFLETLSTAPVVSKSVEDLFEARNEFRKCRVILKVFLRMN